MADGAQWPHRLGFPVRTADPALSHWARPAGTAVERSAVLADVSAVADASAHAALAGGAAVAAVTDIGSAAGRADVDRSNLTAHSAQPSRALVAGATKRTVGSTGGDRPRLPATRARRGRPRRAMRAQRCSGDRSGSRCRHPVAARALLLHERVVAVTQAADPAVRTARDNLIKASAAVAGTHVDTGQTAAAAPPAGRALLRQRIGATTPPAGQFRHRPAMACLAEDVQEPYQRGRTVRWWTAGAAARSYRPRRGTVRAPRRSAATPLGA